MRKITVFYTLFVTVIAFSCTSIEPESPSLRLLNPNLNLNSKAILNQGLKKVPLDVPLYSYNHGDTVVLYQLTMDKRKVLSEKWVIPFDVLDSLTLLNFLREKNGVIMTIINFQSITENTFCIQNFRNKLIFFCTIERVEDKYKLYINFDYPQ